MLIPKYVLILKVFWEKNCIISKKCKGANIFGYDSKCKIFGHVSSVCRREEYSVPVENIYCNIGGKHMPYFPDCPVRVKETGGKSKGFPACLLSEGGEKI
jgi:hypothetical protein